MAGLRRDIAAMAAAVYGPELARARAGRAPTTVPRSFPPSRVGRLWSLMTRLAAARA